MATDTSATAQVAPLTEKPVVAPAPAAQTQSNSNAPAAAAPSTNPVADESTRSGTVGGSANGHVDAVTYPKITLHWLNISRAHRILWLLEELELKYELKVYKRGADMLAPPELKKIHPLGKSPLLEVQASADSEPMVIAESALIVEYLIDHFGTQFQPKRYREGLDGKACGETAEFMRFRYFMHYAEGSLMPFLIIALIMMQLKGPAVPFFIRPLTKAVAGRIEAAFLTTNLARSFEFVENQLATSPNNGQFLAGTELTGADIMMVYPLESAWLGGVGLTKEKHPKTINYVETLLKRDAYQRAIQRVEKATGEKYKAFF